LVNSFIVLPGSKPNQNEPTEKNSKASQPDIWFDFFKISLGHKIIPIKIPIIIAIIKFNKFRKIDTFFAEIFYF